MGGGGGGSQQTCTGPPYLLTQQPQLMGKVGSLCPYPRHGLRLHIAIQKPDGLQLQHPAVGADADSHAPRRALDRTLRFFVFSDINVDVLDPWARQRWGGVPR